MEQFAVKPVITFGTGALAALEELPGERVLVITDGFLAKSGLLDKVLAHLKGRTVEIFDQVVPDPPIDLVAKGARALADFKPRTVVAFGGGSPMDCAKAMAHFSTIRPPLWAIPTTAGTGSEVTSFAVLTDPVRGIKYPLVDDELLPDQAILDPALLAGVPPAVTADTGMDVLTHAAEAYVAKGASPYSDALAEKAFTLAWENLRPAWESQGESRAKRQMLLASNLAGMAFNAAGLGLCHSLAHALGGKFHVPHGRLNALIFPHVLRFNAAGKEAAAKYGQLARLCGLAPNPRALAAGWNRLRSQLKLPDRLTACGVETRQLHAALDELTAAALGDLCAPANPRSASAEDVKALLKELA